MHDISHVPTCQYVSAHVDTIRVYKKSVYIQPIRMQAHTNTPGDYLVASEGDSRQLRSGPPKGIRDKM